MPLNKYMDKSTNKIAVDGKNKYFISLNGKYIRYKNRWHEIKKDEKENTFLNDAGIIIYFTILKK